MDPAISIPFAAISDFCRKWKVREFSLFGSVLRGDFGPTSDVDVLVSFEPNDPWSLMDLAAMQIELESVFQRRVDLIEDGTIKNPYRRASIERGKRLVYAA